MKTLPNGLTVFNATPHPITFWMEGWAEVVVVETNKVISAQPVEELVSTLSKWEYSFFCRSHKPLDVELVRTTFVGSDEGQAIAQQALLAGADVVVGSIIAAQAYPGLVMAMVPAPGYERKPPAEKRMQPGKFTIF